MIMMMIAQLHIVARHVSTCALASALHRGEACGVGVGVGVGGALTKALNGSVETRREKAGSLTKFSTSRSRILPTLLIHVIPAFWTTPPVAGGKF